MDRSQEQRTVAILRREIPGLGAVYLFGSTTDPAVPAPRDVDLAILAASPLGVARRWATEQRLGVLLRRDVDLVDLRTASTVLRMQVVAHGRVLFEADAVARETFENAVFAAYARLNESRRALVRDIVRRGRIYA